MAKETKRQKAIRYIETRDSKLGSGKSWHLRDEEEKERMAEYAFNDMKKYCQKHKIKCNEEFKDFYKRYKPLADGATDLEIGCLSTFSHSQLDQALQVMKTFKYQQFAEVQMIAIVLLNISRWIDYEIYKPHTGEPVGGG